VSDVRCRARPAGSEFGVLDPGSTANVNRVLEALDLPIRMGSDEAAVRALAAGEVLSFGYPGEWYDMYEAVARGTVSSLSFACRAPDIYHMRAVVHSSEGLLKLSRVNR